MRNIGKLTQLDPSLAFQRIVKKPTIYGDGGGLYLRVVPPSACSWVFRYMLKGKSRAMGLGAYPNVTLLEARELATKARLLKAAGMDPLAVSEFAHEVRAVGKGKFVDGRRVIRLNEAHALDLRTYFTGKPCVHGHLSERSVSNCACLQCMQERKSESPKVRRSWRQRAEVALLTVEMLKQEAQNNDV